MDTFDEKVARTVEQLRNGSYATMGAEIASRRLEWLERVLPGKGDCRRYSPRQAYELLFFEQMGLGPTELPVVAESADEIVWLSYNRCVLLEACTALGLDTRRVCRAVNEKATQAFFSRINPALRFHRSYEEIRPHADYCRERIIRIDLEGTMREAIREAERSRAEGGRAGGAVVMLGERIIARAHDVAGAERDPGLHAAAAAMREAARATGDADLCGAILCSTCAPCAACASLAIRANLTTIVYGVSRHEVAGSGQGGAAEASAIEAAWSIEVIGGVLREECRALCQ